MSADPPARRPDIEDTMPTKKTAAGRKTKTKAKAKLVMRAGMSGLRNGRPWPPIGDPPPDGIGNGELEQLLNAGIIGPADVQVETATAADADVEVS